MDRDFVIEDLDLTPPDAYADLQLYLARNFALLKEQLMHGRDFFFDVSAGKVDGMFSINVPGHSDGISTTISTIGTYDNILQTYSADGVDDIDSISSSNAADVHEIVIIGLSAAHGIVKQTVTLNGQTRVPLDTAVNRVQVVHNAQKAAIQTLGALFVYVNTTLSGGIPIDTTKIRSYIGHTSGISNETDSNSVKTIPAGKVGMIVFGKTTVTDAKALELTFWARPYGGVFTQRHHIDIKNTNYDYFFKSPFLIPSRSDIEVRGTIDVGAGESTVNYDVILMNEELVGPNLNPIYLP